MRAETNSLNISHTKKCLFSLILTQLNKLSALRIMPVFFKKHVIIFYQPHTKFQFVDSNRENQTLIKAAVDRCLKGYGVEVTMSDAKRRKDSNRAALSKCWTEDIEWELIPNTLREVSLGNNLAG